MQLQQHRPAPEGSRPNCTGNIRRLAQNNQGLMEEQNGRVFE